MTFQSQQEKKKRIRSVIDELQKSTNPDGCLADLKAMLTSERNQADPEVGCCGIAPPAVPIGFIENIKLLENAVATLEEGKIPETIALLEKYDN